MAVLMFKTSAKASIANSMQRNKFFFFSSRMVSLLNRYTLLSPERLPSRNDEHSSSAVLLVVKTFSPRASLVLQHDGNVSNECECDSGSLTVQSNI